MRVYLVNPRNPAIALSNLAANPLNKWRIWKPLGLLNLAACTPAEWSVTVIDENVATPDYAALPRPDLVGVTAFTSQAPRAYEIASSFRSAGIPVVMGGIHATMCRSEAAARVDAVVTGEAEEVWPRLLEDAAGGRLKREYAGGLIDMAAIPAARHELLPSGYIFGSIQTTRGCPLSCDFCSVSTFSGRTYRARPTANVIEELRSIKEKYLLIVDDNLIGTSSRHFARAKELFRAMIDARIRKRWISQVTVNMADDEELLRLAAESGCFGVFIGFESPDPAGLREVNKPFNARNGRDFAACCRSIQSHGISVCGSFIMGLDVDTQGIGARIADAGNRYGLGLLNLMFMTPLPGTNLWNRMEATNRIAAGAFPEDWKNYTLTLPVATYRHLSWTAMFREFESYWRNFYSYRRILRRSFAALGRRRGFVGFVSSLITNLIFRFDIKLDLRLARSYDVRRGGSLDELLGADPSNDSVPASR